MICIDQASDAEWCTIRSRALPVSSNLPGSALISGTSRALTEPASASVISSWMTTSLDSPAAALEVPDLQRHRARREHRLVRRAGVPGHHGAQQLMAGDHVIERSLQHGEIHRAGDPQRADHHEPGTERPALITLVKGDEPFLGQGTAGTARIPGPPRARIRSCQPFLHLVTSARQPAAGPAVALTPAWAQPPPHLPGCAARRARTAAPPPPRTAPPRTPGRCPHAISEVRVCGRACEAAGRRHISGGRRGLWGRLLRTAGEGYAPLASRTGMRITWPNSLDEARPAGGRRR